MATKTHVCGGTILTGRHMDAGGGSEEYRYCHRCGAFAYGTDTPIPDGTDPEANNAAWNAGEDASPARSEVKKTSSLCNSKISHIVKREDGYHVLSDHKKDGKYRNMGGPYKSRKEALKRLREVEYFKHHSASLKMSAKLLQADDQMSRNEAIRIVGDVVDGIENLQKNVVSCRKAMQQFQSVYATMVKSIPLSRGGYMSEINSTWRLTEALEHMESRLPWAFDEVNKVLHFVTGENHSQ